MVTARHQSTDSCLVLDTAPLIPVTVLYREAISHRPDETRRLDEMPRDVASCLVEAAWKGLETIASSILNNFTGDY